MAAFQPILFESPTIIFTSRSNIQSMPEFARHVLSIKKIGPICPLLNEGEMLPEGLSDEQRLCLTQGRLAKDFSMGIKLVKNP